jgi:hypothetical protein
MMLLEKNRMQGCSGQYLTESQLSKGPLNYGGMSCRQRPKRQVVFTPISQSVPVVHLFDQLAKYTRHMQIHKMIPDHMGMLVRMMRGLPLLRLPKAVTSHARPILRR